MYLMSARLRSACLIRIFEQPFYLFGNSCCFFGSFFFFTVSFLSLLIYFFEYYMYSYYMAVKTVTIVFFSIIFNTYVTERKDHFMCFKMHRTLITHLDVQILEANIFRNISYFLSRSMLIFSQNIKSKAVASLGLF